MNDTVQAEVLDESVIEVEENQQLDNDVENVDNIDTTDVDVPDSEEPIQSKSQNAKQRLRRKLREEQAQNQRILADKQALEAKLAEFETKLDPILNPPAPRPNRVDFDTEEDYEDSLYNWRSEAQSKPAPQPVQKQELPQLQVSPEVQDNWLNQMDDTSERYDDFETALISIPPQAMTDSMTVTIMESKNAGEIAYFLGKNHGEADRISRLSIAAQVREIDKLGDKFKKITSAPDPLNTVNHKGDTTTKRVDPLLEGATFT